MTVSNSQEGHFPSMPSSIRLRTIMQMHRAERLSKILLEIIRIEVFKLSSFCYFRFFFRNANLSTVGTWSNQPIMYQPIMYLVLKMIYCNLSLIHYRLATSSTYPFYKRTQNCGPQMGDPGMDDPGIYYFGVIYF